MTLTENLIQKAQHVGLNTYYVPISYDDFIQLDPWIKQRDDLLRIEKSKTNHMNKLGDTHLLVAIGILTEDDTDEDGQLYKAGSTFILDANTRKRNWKNGNVDQLPPNLLAIVYKKATLKELHFIYSCYDSPDSCETSGEALTGAYRLLGFNPISPKFIDGQIGTALNFASMWTYGAPLYGTNKGINGIEAGPNETKTAKKREASALQLQYFLPQIQYLDKFNLKKDKGIDQPLLTAILAATKAFADDPYFEEIINACNDKEYYRGKTTNAIGKILQAADQIECDEVYRKTSEAKYDTYRRAYNYYLYWIVRYVENAADRKVGNVLKNRKNGFDGDMIIREDGSYNAKWGKDENSYGKEFNQKYIRPKNINVLEKLRQQSTV